MALTADEEEALLAFLAQAPQLRALLAAVRKLPDAPTRSAGIADGPTKAAVAAIEQHVRAIASALRKV